MEGRKDLALMTPPALIDTLEIVAADQAAEHSCHQIKQVALA
jgi:hypothetical protein